MDYFPMFSIFLSCPSHLPLFSFLQKKNRYELKEPLNSTQPITELCTSMYYEVQDPEPLIAICGISLRERNYKLLPSQNDIFECHCNGFPTPSVLNFELSVGKHAESGIEIVSSYVYHCLYLTCIILSRE